MTFTPLAHAADALRSIGATPVSAPTTPPDELVTPGFGGFAVIALIVVAVFLLVWDMQRRIRRTRYRAEIHAELDAEAAASDSGGAAPRTAGSERSGDEREDPPRAPAPDPGGSRG